MKFANSFVKGEFAFKALVKVYNKPCWYMSIEYYFSFEDAYADIAKDYKQFELKWPVEIYDNGVVYIPAKEELE